MRDFFTDLLKKTWLKRKSIPVALFLLAMSFITFLVNKSETLSTAIFWCVTGFFILAFIGYPAVCLFCDRLPKAKRDCLAVLFCIDAENDTLFSAAESKLVNNFSASLPFNSSIRFQALCVSKKCVAKYDLNQKDDCLRLLQKTSCVILVNVRYTTDSVDNSENFSLKIDYGVRHPEIHETGERALAYDMGQLGAPLRNRYFEKKQTIDVFDFSTNALVFVCQYIIGFVLLLAGNGSNALDLLKQARKTVVQNDGACFDVETLTQLVDDRLFSAHIQLAAGYLKSFQQDHSMEHLHKVDFHLEQANRIRLDTYPYNLLKAYVLVMLYGDGASAKKCIEKCKLSSQNLDWMYSDAFLCAYSGSTPGRVISKYNKAFSAFTENVVELADYIEIVYEREPEKHALRLALGILYNHMGNHKLANYHLTTYLELTPNIDRRSKEKIEYLLHPAECNTSCDFNCSRCNLLETC